MKDYGVIEFSILGMLLVSIGFCITTVFIHSKTDQPTRAESNAYLHKHLRYGQDGANCFFWDDYSISTSLTKIDCTDIPGDTNANH